MKKIILSIVAVAALVALPMGAKAQVNAGVTGVNAAATVVRAITLTQANELNFGSFTPGTGGTVKLLPGTDGTTINRSKTSDVTLLTTTQNITVSIPTFTVTGEGSYTYTITMPTTITLSNTTSGASGTMSVALAPYDYLSQADITGGRALSGTFGQAAAGEDKFMIDAALTVASAQTSGLYKATFDVSVNYN
jgi:hypothetical protein